MPSPSQMFEHGMEPVKGWFHMSALDFVGKLHSSITFDLPPGRVLHLATPGKEPKDRRLKTGISGTKMPLFAWQGGADFNVSNPGITAGGLFVHQAIAPTGTLNTLVATGGYQLQSTEYDKDQTYLANQLLTAAEDDTDEDVGGVLTNQGSSGLVEQFVDAVCGVVANGEVNSHHRGITVLDFWTYFLPGEAA